MDTFTPIDKSNDTQVWVKTLPSTNDNSETTQSTALVTEIAVISLTRAVKERSINEARTKRYLADLDRLRLAIEAQTYKVPKTIERRIGRLANKHRQVPMCQDS